jgi:hypothetical protein
MVHSFHDKYKAKRPERRFTHAPLTAFWKMKATPYAAKVVFLLVAFDFYRRYVAEEGLCFQGKKQALASF